MQSWLWARAKVMEATFLCCEVVGTERGQNEKSGRFFVPGRVKWEANRSARKELQG